MSTPPSPHTPEKDGFPSLTQKTVFLCSPGDVVNYRKMVRRLIDSLKYQVADDNDTELYSWEVDKSKDGFKDDVPAQKDIYRPDDPKCSALICIFGEKIGGALPEHIPVDVLAPLNAMDDNKPYRLVHRWRPETADKGGFALTGSTYECLSYLANSKHFNKENEFKGGRLFLCFIGDKEGMDDDTKEPWTQNWGNRELRNALIEKYDKAELKVKRMKEDELNLQLLQVRNFFFFLKNHLGHPPQIVSSLYEAETLLENWLPKTLNWTALKTDNDPFKGLEFYDIQDQDVFFGRKEELSEAIRVFNILWDSPIIPTVYRIEGGSGVGKSSFLRAGMAARLQRDHDTRKSTVCVVRPGELLPLKALDACTSHGANDSRMALRVLFSKILDQLNATAQEGSVSAVLATSLLKDFDCIDEESRPHWMADALYRFLEQVDGDENLVMGFDQFEEIVDQMQRNGLRNHWLPVIHFIKAVADKSLGPREHRLGVLYAVQANRLGMMADDPILAQIWSKGGTSKLAFPEQSLRQIIQKPFVTKGDVLLSDELVSELEKHILEFKNNRSEPRYHGSLLPLVALTLKRIYDCCGQPLLKRASEIIATDENAYQRESDGPEKRDSIQNQFDEARSRTTATSPTRHHQRVTLSVDNCEGFLNVEGAIAVLADEAFDEARKVSGPDWTDSALGNLLRRLVTLGNDYNGQLSLISAALPSNPATLNLAQSMTNRRLILSEIDNRIRLVHESILEYWDKASEWVKSERPLLQDAAILQQNAQDWAQREPKTDEYLQGVGTNDVDRAARVLSLWDDALIEDQEPTGIAHAQTGFSKAQLRDFALLLLRTHPTPSRRVEGSPKKSPHILLAARYEDEELLQIYLDKEPDAVNLDNSTQRSSIFWPCFSGNLKMIEMLLDRGADVNHTDSEGWRPIHAAATRGHVECIKTLLRHGARVDGDKAPSNYTPLHLAALNGHEAAVELLCDGAYAIDPSAIERKNWTPMHCAAGNNHAGVLRILQNKGADIEAQLNYGHTPLHLAAREGAHDAAAFLLRQGTDVNKPLANQWTALHLACQKGHPEIVELLLQHGADANAKAINSWEAEDVIKKKIESRSKEKRSADLKEFDWSPLHVAAQEKKARVVGQLCKHARTDLNAVTGNTDSFLHIAVRNNHTELLREIQNHGKQYLDTINFELRCGNGETPLQLALSARNYDFSALLVQCGADINAPLSKAGNRYQYQSNFTLLHDAALHRDLRLLDFLLEHDADPNSLTGRKQTPLHLAAAAGHSDICISLLAKDGTAIELKDQLGETPFHLACLGGHHNIAKLLLREPVEAPADNGVTPLHLAAYAGSLPVAEFLLAEKHDPNCRDRHGWTPLHIAAQLNFPEVADLLLKSGANPNTSADDPAATPLQAAAEIGNNVVVEMLLRNAAKKELASSDKTRAIFLAMRHGHWRTVQCFIDFGASLDQMDDTTGVSLFATFLKARNLYAEQHDSNAESDTLLELFAQQGFHCPDNTINPIARNITTLDIQNIKAITLEQISKPPAISGIVTKKSYGGFNFHEVIGTHQDSARQTDHQKKAIELLPRINPIDGKYRVDASTTEVHAFPLPWYEDVMLYRVKEPKWEDPSLLIYYLVDGEGNIYRLNGTSPPIHEVNKKAPLQLNKDNVLDYLRFFCFFVRGDEGPFYVAESVDDPKIPAYADLKFRRMVQNVIIPVSLSGINKEGHFLCSGTVFYSNAIFIANFAVHPTGMIEMMNDEPIAGDLPEKIYAPIA